MKDNARGEIDHLCRDFAEYFIMATEIWLDVYQLNWIITQYPTSY